MSARRVDPSCERFQPRLTSFFHSVSSGASLRFSFLHFRPLLFEGVSIGSVVEEARAECTVHTHAQIQKHGRGGVDGRTDGAWCLVRCGQQRGAVGNKASWRVMGRKGETKGEAEGEGSKPPRSSVFSVCRGTGVGGGGVAANTASHTKISSHCRRRRAVPSSMPRDD